MYLEYIQKMMLKKWFYDTAPQRVERRKARRIESKQTIEYLAQVQHIRD